MPDDRPQRVAVVIPAKDEATRIGGVIRAVLEAKLPTEIVVVSDGSRDRTAEVARGFPGVVVVELKINQGKAAAMQAGVRQTTSPVLVFVDADLQGLRGTHIDQIALPVFADDCDMCVGIFRGGEKWSDAAMRVSPALSGQRAMKRDLFEAIPNCVDLGMGIEVALNRVAKMRRARRKRVVLYGVSNAHKEKKLGLMKGLAARTRMFKEITEAMIDRKPPRKGGRRRRKW